MKNKLLFVCMGNICRSPTAEGVFRHMVRRAGVEDQFEIDSAGTHDYHIGKAPDTRAQQAARGRGYDLSGLRGRQVSKADFERFDLVLAMDRDNLQNLLRLCPAEHQHKVKLFLEFSRNFDEREVPDPYYGGAQGFEHVLDMVEDAAQGLIEAMKKQ